MRPYLTPTRRRALEIVRDGGPILPGHFAERMWPDSECWRHVHKCGPYGASQGVMMAMAAGGFLGKLGKAGLVCWFGSAGYMLTAQGYAALGPPPS